MKRTFFRVFLITLCCALTVCIIPNAVNAAAKDNYSDLKLASVEASQASTQPSTQPAASEGQASVDNSFMSGIVPWFFILPAIAFVAAIIAKIYHVRKKS